MAQYTNINPSSSPDPKLSQESSTTRQVNPLWNRALDRYRKELGDEDDAQILTEVRSLEDLIAFASTVEPAGSRSFRILNGLGPKMKHVDDLSAIVTLYLGANGKHNAYVWGSLRMIISLISSTDNALQQVTGMLEELSFVLPRLSRDEKHLPMNQDFEKALIDLYSEMICFYARVIKFYEANPHSHMQRAGWAGLENDFEVTMQRVKLLSGSVEAQIDHKIMKESEEKRNEIFEALKRHNDRKARSNTIAHFHYIPVTATGRFKDRETDLMIVQKALSPGRAQEQLQSFALHGMGGVGKTQLALRFALDSKKVFDVILWIAADTAASINKCFGEAAVGLGLGRENFTAADEPTATTLVKNWLTNPQNDQSWLVIFDNADDLNLLRNVWPANGRGAVLVTSRDPRAAFTIAVNGLNLQPFNESIGVDTFIQLLGITHPSNEERLEAIKIIQTLGGLPLALDQMAGFITKRRMRIQDFLPLYQRNTAKLHARRLEFSDYTHSIATVFSMALSGLTGPSQHLQNLIAFLEPNSIPESIFLDGAHLINDPDFEFLTDELDFGDAEEPLLQTALINKDVNEISLSVHRLVQSTVLQKLDKQEKRRYFNIASTLLGFGFPDTWSKDKGHQKTKWVRCERYLPHVNALVKLTLAHESLVDQPDTWAELLLRCSWYLYEKEQYSNASDLVREALKSFTSSSTLAYASAIDLLGLIHLDMARWDEARCSFEVGLSTRQSLLSPSDPLIAFAFNNLALSYTELSDLAKAEQYHKQAIQIRLQNKSDRIGNSYSNYAVTLLRMGQPDEAESMLMQCPSLQGCTDKTFLEADNPRFVGDMILLSRIRRAQGRLDEALRLANKALIWRQNVHGNGFKTCDSMYDVACLLYDQGSAAKCLELLNDVSKIAATLEAGENHQARAEWKASRILKSVHREEESATHENKARSLRRVCRPSEDAKAAKDEASWECLTPYMLW